MRDGDIMMFFEDRRVYESDEMRVGIGDEDKGWCI
jgi:hypothetical protein